MRNGDIKIDIQAGSRTSDHADEGMRVVYSYEDYRIRTGWRPLKLLQVHLSVYASILLNTSSIISMNTHAKLLFVLHTELQPLSSTPP